jgi:hypothetical protein
MMSRLVTLLELELEPLFGVGALRRAHESTGAASSANSQVK